MANLKFYNVATSQWETIKTDLSSNTLPNHHDTHEINGTDEIDLTKLRNYTEQVSTPISNLQADVTNHKSNTSNPHNVTASQLGAVTYTGMTNNVDLNGRKLVNGSNDLIKPDVSGALTFPNQPNFTAASVGLSALSANVETTVPYSGANFNSSGIYTCPVTGVYLFYGAVYLNLTNSTAWLNIYKNNVRQYQMDKYTNTATSQTVDYVLKGMLLLGLNAGDTVKFTATNTASCTVNNAHTYCSVVKVS